VKETDEGSEKRKREEKKKREGIARKVVSAWNILCRPTCTYVVELLTLAIRASVVNAPPTGHSCSIMEHESFQVKQKSF